MTSLQDFLILKYNSIKLTKLEKVCLEIPLMLIHLTPNNSLERLYKNWVWNNLFIIMRYIKAVEKRHLLRFRFRIAKKDREISFQISLLHLNLILSNQKKINNLLLNKSLKKRVEINLFNLVHLKSNKYMNLTLIIFHKKIFNLLIRHLDSRY